MENENETQNTTAGETTSEQITISGNTVNSAALLREHKELIIVHNDDQYKLKLTLNGKLILSK